MAASVWMKFSKVLMPRWVRPSAETMPEVTVWPTPKGLPMASTTSPTRSVSAAAKVIAGSLRSRGDLEHGQIRFGIGADGLGLELAPVVERDLDLVGALDDMVVGEDVALGRDHDAAAQARAALRLLAEAVAEEMAEERVVEEGVARRLDFLAGEDVHHRGHRPLRRLGIGGRRARVGRRRRLAHRNDAAERAGTCRARASHSGLSVCTTNSAATQIVTVWAKISQMRFIYTTGFDTGKPEKYGPHALRNHGSGRQGRHDMDREELRGYLDNLLEAARFRDYCPNGLQVEGRGEVRRVLCGVTASQALIDEAVRRDVDAVLVHHGWFWRGEDGRVTGFRKRRMAALLAHDINLFAYHLPLDAHPELGNNAQLAALLGWQVDGALRRAGHRLLGVSPAPTFSGELAARIGQALGREALLVGDAARPVTRVAWCSGGAQGYFEQAILAGADVYVSGEISEQTVHLARESGVPYIAAGHHATERYGVQALGRHLAENCGLACEYVELDNPV